MHIGGLQKLSLVDYPGKTCAIVFTIGCNFRCPYCHNPELVDETADILSEDAVFDFLSRRKNLLDAVTITGGEPTLQEDLIPFIERVKSLGYLVKLDTNGTDAHTLRTIIESNLVDYIAMDIKAPLERYMHVVARPVDVLSIRTSIKHIIDSGIPYEFRTTVVKTQLSPEDFHGIGKLIKGADRYYLQKFVSNKILNPGFIKKTTYTDEEFSDLKNIMETYVTTCDIR